jgi:hypothetical protein
VIQAKAALRYNRNMDMAQDQWRRVQRYYERFKAIDSGVELTPSRSGDHYVDDMYAFFQNCHHLRDWIKNDPSIAPNTRKNLTSKADCEHCLKICADICDGTKHLLRTLHHGKSTVDFMDRSITAHEGSPYAGTVSIKLSIEHNATRLDAFQLATKCVEAWKRISSQLTVGCSS